MQAPARPLVRSCRVLPALAVGMVLAMLAGCTTPEPVEPVPTGPLIRIGTGPEPESQLLAAILAELVEREGHRPEIVDRADSAAARQALELGDVDILPGYTGQAWLEDLGLPNPPGDPRTSFARVATVDGSRGIRWMRPRFDTEDVLDTRQAGPPADATFGLFVRGVPAPDADVFTVTQLATRLAERPEARVCVDEEFAVRSDGWQALAVAYSIAPRPLTWVGPTEAVQAVAAGECFVGLSASTDGEAWAAGLRLLADPLEVFPAFVVSVQVRDESAQGNTRLVTSLQPFADEVTTALLGTWNGQVVQGAAVADVAVDAATVLRRRAGIVEPPAVP